MAIVLNNVSYLDKINNITYTFEDNKITSIIGASGSGKTLLSYLMTGLVLPTDGEIEIYEDIINKNTKNFKNIRKNIGYVFQNPEEEFFTTSVKEELEFSLKKNKYSNEEIEKIIKNTLDEVGLNTSYLNRNPFTLSSGEKEKLAIAIALLLDPKILILDEPTIFLDNKSTMEIISLLKKLNQRDNKLIIIITNDIDFVYKISDNILLLKKGKINLATTKDNLIENTLKIKRSGMEISKILEFILLAEKLKNKKLTLCNDINKLVSEIKENV